jgi:tRNA-dihydrouridine synthase
MRKHFSNYIKGFPGASIFRQKLVTAPGLAEMRSALNEFMEAAQNIELELV